MASQYPHKATAITRFKAHGGQFALTSGQMVTVLSAEDDDGDWVKVVDDDGATGVVPSGILTKEESEGVSEEPQQIEESATVAATTSASPKPGDDDPPMVKSPAVEETPTVSKSDTPREPAAPAPMKSPPPPSRKPSIPLPSSTSSSKSNAPAVATKPSGLRDRIALFNQPAASSPPAPRPKPPVARKPLSVPKVQADVPEPLNDSQKDKGGSGMSAADAEESVRAGGGGSLKERIKLLQKQQQQQAQESAPDGERPKQKREWKRPPIPPVEEMEGAVASSVSPQTGIAATSSPQPQLNLPSSSDADEEVSENQIAAPLEAEAEEQFTEDEEAGRRRRLAERMAKLGGARIGFGFGPPDAAASRPSPEPAVATLSNEAETLTSEEDADASNKLVVPPPSSSDALALPESDKTASSKSPVSVTMPAVPRRSGPPRRRGATNASLSPATSVKSIPLPTKSDADHKPIVDTLEKVSAAPEAETELNIPSEVTSIEPEEQNVDQHSSPLMVDSDAMSQLQVSDVEPAEITQPEISKIAQSPPPSPPPTNAVLETFNDVSEVMENAVSTSLREEVALSGASLDGVLGFAALDFKTSEEKMVPSAGIPEISPVAQVNENESVPKEEENLIMFSPPPVPSKATKPAASSKSPVVEKNFSLASPVEVPERPPNPTPATALGDQPDQADLIDMTSPPAVTDVFRSTDEAEPPESTEQDSVAAKRAALAKRMAAMGGMSMLGGMPRQMPKQPQSLPSAEEPPVKAIQELSLESPPVSRPKGPRPQSIGSPNPNKPKQPEETDLGTSQGPDESEDNVNIEPSNAQESELPQTVSRQPTRQSSNYTPTSPIVSPIEPSRILQEELTEGHTTTEPSEGDDEMARKRRLAERMAKLGGRPMMGGMMPMFGASKPVASHPSRQASTTSETSIELPTLSPIRSPSYDAPQAPLPPPKRPPPPAQPATVEEVTQDSPEASEDDSNGQADIVDDESDVDTQLRQPQYSAPLPPPRPVGGHVLASTPQGKERLSNRPPVPSAYASQKRASISSQHSKASSDGASLGRNARMTRDQSYSSYLGDDGSGVPPSAPMLTRPMRSPPLPEPSASSPTSSPTRRSLSSGRSPSESPKLLQRTLSVEGHARRASLDAAATDFAYSVLPSSESGSGIRTSYQARDLDVASEKWWRQKPVSPPTSLSQQPDLLTSVRGSSSLHNGVTNYQYTLSVIYSDYSKTIVSVAFEDGDDLESRTNLRQQHFAPPTLLPTQKLVELSSVIGARLFANSKSKEGTKLSKNVDSVQFVKSIFETCEDVLEPIGSNYGQVVFKFEIQANGPDTQVIDEIRLGDVIASYGAVFKGKGIGHSSMNLGSASQPHVAIVGDNDPSKNKLKAYSAGHGKVELLSYRLDELKAGTIKVFRVVHKGWVGL